MLFMLFGAFDVAVRHSRPPGDHIGCIISCLPPIHGTFHIWLAASSCTAAATGNRHCACGGVFVVCSVVDSDAADTFQSLLCLWRRICRPLFRRWRRQYEFIHFAPSAASLLFAPSSMTMKPIRFNHFGNQHGLHFEGLLQLGYQTQFISITWL